MSTYTATIFNQIFWLMKDHISPLVGQLNKYSKKFDYNSLLKILLYAQISWKDSIRDIETSLGAHSNELYHLWLSSIARSTISYWNNKVPDSVLEELFYKIYEKYNSKYIMKNKSMPINCIALDSTLVSLALSTHNRAKHRTTKWGIRVHVWLDVQDCIPRFLVIKNANIGDNIVANELIKEWRLYKWECIVFDRYYVDFDLWKLIDEKWSYFVTRTKKNTDYIITKYNEVKEKNIILDWTIELFWNKWRKKYIKELRIVRFYDEETDREFEYITNNMELSAWQIADIYKNRWRIEEFFKRVKQNLRIKSFLGSSEKAIKNQIRVAMIYYLLTHYLAYSAKIDKQKILKLIRIIREKCLYHISMVDIFAMLHQIQKTVDVKPPPWSLFHF